ncbi:YtxH domain-containing protein [Sporosarcina siberiensis]|uniref:YtxH domain-containing protein n=1 Tax=Sporosarcina siberiensis TaxID=1365606 RepID=A0ABW4SEL7_9BACL
MGKSKFGTFIMIGALTGALASMMDRSTRVKLGQRIKFIKSEVEFYSKSTDVLKIKFEEKKDKIQSVVGQFTEDATYVKEKVDELKLLTPQVKDMVSETKETFTESKDEYKSIVNESGLNIKK